MQTVTGFDSGTEEETSPLVDYRRLVESLDRTDIEVVLDNFTRIAKRALRKCIPDASYLEAKDARDLRPIWVCEWSVVVDVPEPDKRTKDVLDQLCSILVSLVNEVGAAIRRSPGGDGRLFLVDSLSTRITRVGPRSLRFILKQKWCSDE